MLPISIEFIYSKSYSIIQTFDARNEIRIHIYIEKEKNDFIVINDFMSMPDLIFPNKLMPFFVCLLVFVVVTQKINKRQTEKIW